MSSSFKKILSLLLVLSLVLTAALISDTGISYAGSGSADITGPEMTAEAGGTLNVPINISGNPGICGLGLKLTYDKEVLTPVSVTATDLTAEGTYNDSIETSTDNSFMIVWASSDNITADGTLFIVSFNVSEFAEGSTDIGLSYSQSDTFNEDIEDVALNCSSVNVTVTQSASASTMLKSRAGQEVNAGEEIEIPILIDNVEKISALSFDVQYDDTVFTPAGVTDGIGACTSEVSDGKISLNAAAIDTSVDSGILATLTFKAAEYSGGSYVFYLSSEDALARDFRVRVINTHAGENAVVYGKNVSLNGNDLAVDIGIRNNHGIAAFRFTMTYDASMLTPVSVTKDQTLSGSFGTSMGEAEGVFDVLWFSSDDFTQDGTLYTARFTVNDGAAGITPLGMSYSQGDTCDENMYDVILTMKNVMVNLASDDPEAAANVEALINSMDPEDEGSVTDARTAYDALTDEQKALVDPEVLKRLIEAEEEFNPVSVDLSTLDFRDIEPHTWDGNAYHPYDGIVYLNTGDPGTLTQNEDYTVSYHNDVNAGTGTAVLSGIGRYTGTRELNFQILPADMTAYKESYQLDKTAYVYNGSVRTPELQLKADAEGYNEYTPVSSDYTLKCSTDRKSVGKHTVTIVFKGNLSGSLSYAFRIDPKGTTLSKLVKGKKSMTVKWKKQAAKMASSRITGYQIRYSLKANMANSKSVKVKGYGKTSSKIKKLKSKKTYYVQIRTYRTIGKVTCYSSWSAKKKVKVK